MENLLSVMYNIYKRNDLIDVIYKDGAMDKLTPQECIILSKYKQLSNSITNPSEIIHNEKFVYKNNTIIMHGLINSGDLIGIYINEEYKCLKVKEKIVVDIGCNIGDSSIYFILNGAKKVIALEPYPYSFNLAVENIKANKMTDVVELINAGYGQSSEIHVDENQINTVGLPLKPVISGRLIKILSLKELVEKYNLSNCVLKMDCEGCEYNLLNEDNSILARFSQIQIEYHHGYTELVEKLRNVGFNVNFTKPKTFFALKHIDPTQLTGYICASKL